MNASPEMLDLLTPEDLMALQEHLESQRQGERRAHWIRQARVCFDASTDYLETAVRPQWEKNLHHFRGMHAPGSRLASADYRRSKIFRPKTRSSLRQHEATLAAALFTNTDLIDVSPVGVDSPLLAASAKLNQAILQHRLEKTIPWFLTCVGAYQDTHNYGVCVSKQYWQFEQRIEMRQAFDEAGQPITDEDGNPLGREQRITVSDKPVVDLLPPENFRFDPNCDWRDPVGDSPYLIELMPMYAGRVLERMKTIDPKTGQPEWLEHELAAVLSAGATSHELSGVRQAREGKRTDPLTTHSGDEFTTVWVHFNIIREDGIDYAFYTVGPSLLLTEPVPLSDIFRHGRPYVLGVSSLEAHRNYPAGTTELIAPMQEETNNITNQRMDNVALVLNKRYRIRRGANVDLEALMRNTPGGGYLVNDINQDVAIETTPDVTSSSYSEQDRLSVELDELAGNFSQSSVQSSRTLNETVGGMNLMNSGANQVQEYVIRLFIETWAEKVLRQLVLLEQHYETDQTVLAIGAEQAQLFQRFGTDEVTDQLLQQELTVKINIGMGNTNPTQKIQKLTMGINAVSSVPTVAERLQPDELVAEVFSALGFGRGARFVKPFDQWQQEQQVAAQGQQGPDAAMLRAQIDQQRLQLDAERLQFEREKAQGQAELATRKLEMEFELKVLELQQEADLNGASGDRDAALEQLKLQTARDIAALREGNRTNELAFKAQSGREGI